jgi:hypothetical protein
MASFASYLQQDLIFVRSQPTTILQNARVFSALYGSSAFGFSPRFDGEYVLVAAKGQRRNEYTYYATKRRITKYLPER